MHFTTLVVLLFLFIAAIDSTQDEEMLLKLVKMLMCDEEFAEIREAMEECSKDQDYSIDLEIYKICGVELSSSDMAGIGNYYCITSIEEIIRDSKCFAKNIKEMGKEEELKQRSKPVEECMKATLEQKKRK
ncbi:uncharacterized protein LOC129964191 [Argiope bruennichi]|uniref:uncharacterized protein LOC129964191 n=1 Tax=Argiope bruennichi TaxID=94029 RepID=UPI002494153D|nr:uncharacterized protein LOC129964191 [Argiope bruennichi]